MTLAHVFGALLVVCLMVFLGFRACDPAVPKKALERNGYTDVVIGGITMDCGRDNTGHTFTATNPMGFRMNGSVCCNLWGSCYTRL